MHEGRRKWLWTLSVNATQTSRMHPIERTQSLHDDQPAAMGCDPHTTGGELGDDDTCKDDVGHGLDGCRDKLVRPL
ncbi:uncharacterized protein SPSK_00962 [Sporothrix schenckii 1099-18]|uniref:Uncharacterized protein n=1 Tax=Sporothrix schenckii 1099-18 TaxID=1397361 RepID=A0A0F2LWC5_SPOSC|nr:uncharacterized protein SPSK_00962 [Sporothrix schenckii 1099-18]KJR81772.1 hypothetical protein SPSK_00962 [Sporothrix schenckii 1099-18]